VSARAARGVAGARCGSPALALLVLALAFALAVPALAADAPAAASAKAADDGAAALEQPTMRDDRDVLDSSEKWLRLIDRGQYGAAWDVSAAFLKGQVTRPQWVKGIGDARKPFGVLKARKPDRFARSHQMPGAPDGDYAIAQFESDFTNGKHATEQITWMLEPDGGIWRVSGYYIR